MRTNSGRPSGGHPSGFGVSKSIKKTKLYFPPLRVAPRAPVSSQFEREAIACLKKMPLWLRKALMLTGWKIELGHSIVEMDAASRQEDRLGLDSLKGCAGLARFPEKKILVPEYMTNLMGTLDALVKEPHSLLKTRSQKERFVHWRPMRANQHYQSFTQNGHYEIAQMKSKPTLRHEVGHALDELAGFPSETLAFRQALIKDVARMHPDDRDELEDFIQPLPSGRPSRKGALEAFADVAGTLLGGSAYYLEDMANRFPNTMQKVRQVMAEQKAVWDKRQSF